MNLIQITVISTTVSKKTLRNRVAIIVKKKRVRNAVLGCNLKNNRTFSVRFQGEPFSIITVIQVYAPTTNAEEAEVEWFYEGLRDILELTPQKDVLFIIGDHITQLHMAK